MSAASIADMAGMATLTLIDETTRPKAPPIAGATPRDRQRGRVLAQYHAMHLQQMAEVRRLIAAIGAGEQPFARFADAVGNLDLAQNYRLFGAVCGEECQMLTFHHTAEDQQMFPALLARGDAGLRRVVERLMEEHLVVHALIDELQVAADGLMAEPGPERFAAAVAVFDQLEVVVKSHFGYEETELAEALGAFGLI